MKQVRDALMVAHTSEGELVRRPLSPHMQVYRPQLSSVLSIMNRVTGLALSLGTILLVWWLAAAAGGPASFATVQAFLHTWVGLFLLFGWTVSLFYHLFGGIRHLAWDAGYGYDLPQMHMTGWVVVILTLVCSLITWAVGFWMWPGR